MVIWSLDALKKFSMKKETGIEKEIVEVLQQASDRRENRKAKHRNDEILGFDLVFVG